MIGLPRTRKRYLYLPRHRRYTTLQHSSAHLHQYHGFYLLKLFGEMFFAISYEYIYTYTRIFITIYIQFAYLYLTQKRLPHYLFEISCSKTFYRHFSNIAKQVRRKISQANIFDESILDGKFFQLFVPCLRLVLCMIHTTQSSKIKSAFCCFCITFIRFVFVLVSRWEKIKLR